MDVVYFEHHLGGAQIDMLQKSTNFEFLPVFYKFLLLEKCFHQFLRMLDHRLCVNQGLGIICSFLRQNLLHHTFRKLLERIKDE